mgnify:CR=1 FL=1
MFDRYIICEHDFHNIVSEQGVVGFQLRTRLPYYRGLGLSMVHRVVNNAGGDIEVVSSPESGTTFIIDLPVHQPSLMLDIDEAASRGALNGDEP